MQSQQFILLMTDSGLMKYEFDDLCRHDWVQVIKDVMMPLRNPILRMLRKLHFSKKINLKLPLPFKGIWNRTLVFNDWKFRDNVQYYVLITTPTLRKISGSALKKLKRSNLKIVLLMIDAIESKEAYAAKRLVGENIFDYIFSFDKKNSEEYGFFYTQDIYSKLLGTNSEPEVMKDLCLIANDKGRIRQLHDIYESSEKNDVTSIYVINAVKKSNRKYEYAILYNKTLNYLEVLEKSLHCNCLLEVLIQNQSGATLRYYEAVCYNKKLLTTNKNVVNLPFYNPEYMKVFEKPEDIDWEWVKKREPIDYGYDGRFSPVKLIDKILELETQKEGC